MAQLFPIRNDCTVKLCFSRLLIATIDFECTNHVDKVDLTSFVKHGMLDDLEEIINNPIITNKWLEEAKNARSFLRCHDSSVPTTCCYQVLKDDPDDEVEVIQFFCLPSLGICYRIKSFWSHCFMAACFSHLTSTPIYV